jgi:hypothetical protein
MVKALAEGLLTGRSVAQQMNSSLSFSYNWDVEGLKNHCHWLGDVIVQLPNCVWRCSSLEPVLTKHLDMAAFQVFQWVGERDLGCLGHL